MKENKIKFIEVKMEMLAKILGSIIGLILYPFFWLLEWGLLINVSILATLENLMGDETNEMR